MLRTHLYPVSSRKPIAVFLLAVKTPSRSPGAIHQSSPTTTMQGTQVTAPGRTQPIVRFPTVWCAGSGTGSTKSIVSFKSTPRGTLGSMCDDDKFRLLHRHHDIEHCIASIVAYMSQSNISCAPNPDTRSSSTQTCTYIHGVSYLLETRPTPSLNYKEQSRPRLLAGKALTPVTLHPCRVDSTARPKHVQRYPAPRPCFPPCRGTSACTHRS